MIKLKKNKPIEIPYDDGEGNSFSIVWSFPNATDASWIEIRKKIQEAVIIEPEDTEESKVVKRDDTLVFDAMLEQSIQSVNGFVDEDGNPIDLNFYRKEIYNYIKTLKDYWKKVVLAYDGVRPKNLLASSLQQSTGDGNQVTASSVPSVTEEKPTVTSVEEKNVQGS